MTLAAFLALASVQMMAAISPGPAVLMSARTGLTEGFRTGLMLAMGIGAGSMLAGRLSRGRIEYGLIPPGAALMAVAGLNSRTLRGPAARGGAAACCRGGGSRRTSRHV